MIIRYTERHLWVARCPDCGQPGSTDWLDVTTADDLRRGERQQTASVEVAYERLEVPATSMLRGLILPGCTDQLPKDQRAQLSALFQTAVPKTLTYAAAATVLLVDVLAGANAARAVLSGLDVAEEAA